jgi:hypothetical protein
MTRANVPQPDVIDGIERRFVSGRWDDIDLKMLLALSRAAVNSTDPATVNAVEIAAMDLLLSKNLRDSWRLCMEKKSDVPA